MQRSALRLAAAATAFLAPLSIATCSSNPPTSFKGVLLSLRATAFAQPLQQTDVDSLLAAKIVIFGEIHETQPCVELQCRTAKCMLDAMDETRPIASALHIVLEHFNFDAQRSLSAWSCGDMSFAALADSGAYEGHDISVYQPLLEFARLYPGRVHLHAGFIPRHYARTVMREGLEPALAAAKAMGYLADDETCEGSDAHYNFFESLLTGRNMHDSTCQPSASYRDMFPAQIIKDASMAYKVHKIVDSAHPDDRILVICGIGHSGFSHGVPERIFAAHPELRQRCFRILSLPLPPDVDTDAPLQLHRALAHELGAPGHSDPADACLAFVQADGNDVSHSTSDSAGDASKAETAAAYNKVGASAHVQGSQRKAHAVMTRLGYTEDQITIAGCDASNFQGVGNPHKHAAIRQGQAVLDIGSGLGIDSFIAAQSVGQSGSVIGVDIAQSQVLHAVARAVARGLSQLRFAVGDLERLPLPSDCVDVVISNGAFCLVPDKLAAFREVARVLKPGGRFSICTTVVKSPLHRDKWPLCMRMFAELQLLQPACEAAGLVHVQVDLSDPLVSFELPDDAPERDEEVLEREGQGGQEHGGGSSKRHRIHVASSEFAHLARYDMNELCARVVVIGQKPLTPHGASDC